MNSMLMKMVRCLWVLSLVAGAMIAGSIKTRAAAPPTMDDLWSGEAVWQHYYTWPFYLDAPDSPGWHACQANSIHVQGDTWYWFRRYIDADENIGMVCVKSTDKGMTWSEPVTVLKPESGTLWSWMVTDGDFYYDKDENKWRCIIQVIDKNRSPWKCCYFERKGADPMGMFTTPEGFTQPAIDAKEIWNQIANDPSDDAVKLAGGEIGAVFDEGTPEILEKVGDTFTITFHGAFVYKDKVHGVRGIATTKDFQHYTPLAPDAFIDEKDSDTWHVNWDGGSIGVGAQTCLKCGDYWYSMIEGADKGLGGADEQNWTWGLSRTKDLSSTAWENWPNNPVTPFEPHNIIVEWNYAQLFQDDGITYLAISKSFPKTITACLFYQLVWKKDARPTPPPEPGMFSNNFNDGLTEGFLPASGTWVVKANEYCGTAKQDQQAICFAGDSKWTDYTVSARVIIGAEPGAEAGIVFRAADDKNYFLAAMRLAGRVELSRCVDGIYELPLNAVVEISPDNWYELKAIASGNMIKIYLNDKKIAQLEGDIYTHGKIGLWTAAGTQARFDDVRVTEVKP